MTRDAPDHDPTGANGEAAASIDAAVRAYTLAHGDPFAQFDAAHPSAPGGAHAEPVDLLLPARMLANLHLHHAFDAWKAAEFPRSLRSAALVERDLRLGDVSGRSATTNRMPAAE